MLDPFRFERIRPQPLFLVLFIVLEVALEPLHVGFAFEGEDVGADAVEEEAVVADDHGATGEVDEGVFERSERFDVEVVGRLIKEKDVAA